MNLEDRTEYVQYRIKSAKKTFEAAKILAENKFWNSAVNRLYYAVFYTVNALLIMNEIQTKSHSATKSQFSLNFVKQESLTRNMESYCPNYLNGDKKVITRIYLTTTMIPFNHCLNRFAK